MKAPIYGMKEVIFFGSDFADIIYEYMGVSENGGTPKWMVYSGKPNLNG